MEKIIKRKCKMKTEKCKMKTDLRITHQTINLGKRMEKMNEYNEYELK